MSKFPQRVRYEIWTRDNGNVTEGLCFVCNCALTIIEFEVGHIVAKAKGGSDELNNLKAICGSCNRSMGTQNLFEYKKRYYAAGSSRSVVDNLIDLDSTELQRDKLIQDELAKRNLLVKNKEEEIEKIRKVILGEEINIKNIEKIIQIEESKIEDIEKIILIEESKIKIIEKEILEIRTSFCDELVNDKLCLKKNCKDHKKTVASPSHLLKTDLIDLSENNSDNRRNKCVYFGTNAGGFCKKNAKIGSKYCSSHPMGMTQHEYKDATTGEIRTTALNKFNDNRNFIKDEINNKISIIITSGIYRTIISKDQPHKFYFKVMYDKRKAIKINPDIKEILEKRSMIAASESEQEALLKEMEFEWIEENE